MGLTGAVQVESDMPAQYRILVPQALGANTLLTPIFESRRASPIPRERVRLRKSLSCRQVPMPIFQFENQVFRLRAHRINTEQNITMAVYQLPHRDPEITITVLGGRSTRKRPVVVRDMRMPLDKASPDLLDYSELSFDGQDPGLNLPIQIRLGC